MQYIMSITKYIIILVKKLLILLMRFDLVWF